MFRLYATTPKQGVGSRVMQIIIEAADEFDFDLYLQTLGETKPGLPTSTDLVRFYSRFGFDPTGPVRAGEPVNMRRYSARK